MKDQIKVAQEVSKPKQVIYQVVSCNLQVEQEARYYMRSWESKEDAIAATKKWMEETKDTRIEFKPKEEKRKEYYGINVEYHESSSHDTFYYHSHWGPFKCAVMIKEVEIEASSKKLDSTYLIIATDYREEIAQPFTIVAATLGNCLNELYDQLKQDGRETELLMSLNVFEDGYEDLDEEDPIQISDLLDMDDSAILEHIDQHSGNGEEGNTFFQFFLLDLTSPNGVVNLF